MLMFHFLNVYTYLQLERKVIETLMKSLYHVEPHIPVMDKNDEKYVLTIIIVKNKTACQIFSPSLIFTSYSLTYIHFIFTYIH